MPHSQHLAVFTTVQRLFLHHRFIHNPTVSVTLPITLVFLLEAMATSLNLLVPVPDGGRPVPPPSPPDYYGSLLSVPQLRRHLSPEAAFVSTNSASNFL